MTAREAAGQDLGYSPATRLTLDQVVDRLEALGCRPRYSGGQVYALCPVHDDRKPSLSVNKTDDGTVLAFCHACGGGPDWFAKDFLTALRDGVRGDLQVDQRRLAQVKGRPQFRFVPATNYHYLGTRDGTPLLKQRGMEFDPDTGAVAREKAFRWWHQVGDGWQPGDGGHCPQLYRHDLLTGSGDRRVLITEGEKDADAVIAAGGLAVSPSHGAGTWRPVWTAGLRNVAHLAVVADDDEPGRHHAETVMAALTADRPERPVPVLLPAVGKDVSDHLAAGRSLAELVQTAVHERAAAGRRIVATRAAHISPKPVPWGWDERLQAAALSVAAGREGTGKSSFSVWLTAETTRGILPGMLYGTPRNVGIAASEDSWEHVIVARLIAAGADLDRVFRLDVADGDVDGMTLVLPSDIAALKTTIMELQIALLIIDPLMSNIDGSLNTNNTRETRKALDPLNRLAQQTHAMVLGICHFNKSTGSDISSLISGSGAFKDVPRSVLGFVRDEGTGERVMEQTKNSAGQDDLPSMKYLLDPIEISTPAGPTVTTRFRFDGHASRTAKQVLRDARHDIDPAERDSRRSETDRCVAWLDAWMSAHDGSGIGSDIKADARREELQWTRKVWRRAMDQLRIDATGKTAEEHSRNVWKMVTAIPPANLLTDPDHSGPSQISVQGHSAKGHSADPPKTLGWKALSSHSGPQPGGKTGPGATVGHSGGPTNHDAHLDDDEDRPIPPPPTYSTGRSCAVCGSTEGMAIYPGRGLLCRGHANKEDPQ